MTDKQHDYDPDLPYVVQAPLIPGLRARFATREDAEAFAQGKIVTIIDTTPAPRVPEDAKWITYSHARTYAQLFAFRGGDEWVDHDGDHVGRLEDLPGVTPETVFTVLDAREERKS